MVESDRRQCRIPVHRSIHLLERPRPAAPHLLIGLPFEKTGVLGYHQTHFVTCSVGSPSPARIQHPSKKKKRATLTLRAALTGFRERTGSHTLFFSLHSYPPMFLFPSRPIQHPSKKTVERVAITGFGNRFFFFSSLLLSPFPSRPIQNPSRKNA